jgi:hypothetical protein
MGKLLPVGAPADAGSVPGSLDFAERVHDRIIEPLKNLPK